MNNGLFWRDRDSEVQGFLVPAGWRDILVEHFPQCFPLKRRARRNGSGSFLRFDLGLLNCSQALNARLPMAVGLGAA